MLRLNITDKFTLYFDIKKSNMPIYEDIARANPELFKLKEEVRYVATNYVNCKVPKCCIKKADLIRRLLKDII